MIAHETTSLVTRHFVSSACRYYNAETGGPKMRETAIDARLADGGDDNNAAEVQAPTSPLYSLNLSPLSPEVLANTRRDDGLAGNQLPLNPPGVTPVGRLLAASLGNIYFIYYEFVHRVHI